MSQDAWGRVQHFGLRAVNPVDLLALVLARTPEDVEAAERWAIDLARRYPGARVADLGPADLHGIAGLESYEAHRLLAALELGRRAAGLGKQTVETVSSDEDAYRLFRWLENEKQEHFCVAHLNAKGGVISTRVAHIGTLTMSVVSPRDVFREAVRANAASVILAHNHPSGDPTPSPEDISITRRMMALGEELDVAVLDHLVIGEGRYVSLNRTGKMG